jgi:hypothetical protein
MIDLGIYRPGGTRVWCGIVIPVTLIALAYTAVSYHCRRVDVVLAERTATARSIPALSDAAQLAEDALAAFASEADNVEADMEQFEKALDATAKRVSFALEELTVSRKPSGVGYRLEASVKGQGSLAAVTEFINLLTGVSSLMTTDRVALGMRRVERETVYEAELLLSLVRTAR